MLGADGAPAWPRVRLTAALALLACRTLAAEEPPAIPGRVIDSVTLAPVFDAVVTQVGRDPALVVDHEGHFEVAGLAAAGLDLVASAPGYVVRRASVLPGAREVEIRLDPEALRRSEEIAVSARTDAAPSVPNARVLETADLARLASVLADDPLRSVQSLPGVASGDDFGATFAVRGLGFGNVGLYVDGVLMSAPFHTVRDVNDGFSLTLLNSNVVQSLSLISGGAPALYGDRIGSVVTATTREGNRERFAGHASLAMTGLQATVEGPLGEGRKTTWLVGARKSYVDYVLQRIDRNGNVLGFHDATVRLAHHPGPGQTVSASWLHGRSRWTNANDGLRPQDSKTADAGTDLGTLQWQWLPSSRTEVRALGFFSSETGLHRNLDGTERLSTRRHQAGARADATRVVGSHRLEAGLVYRRLSEDVRAREFLRKPAATYRIVSNQVTADDELGAHVQDSWTGFDGRLGLTAGGRVDRFGATGETRVLPRGSLSWDISGRLRLMGAFGRYAQFPDFQQLYGRGGNPDLRAEQATHAVVGLEHRLGHEASVRLELYDLHVDGGFFNPYGEWRLASSWIAGPDPGAPLQNALSGRSRGFEVLVQRRSAAGPSGWIAYTFGRSRWEDDAGLQFDGDFDQRHTVTLFASWPLGRRLHLSTKYRLGSGFPVAGFYEPGAGGVVLSEQRNGYRPGGYSRWDIRADKAFLFERWKLTLYGEVINVLNHTHRRYTGLDSLDVGSGRVRFESDTLFPLLPSVGVAVDF